jgi:hypothetical protein
VGLHAHLSKRAIALNAAGQASRCLHARQYSSCVRCQSAGDKIPVSEPPLLMSVTALRCCMARAFSCSWHRTSEIAASLSQICPCSGHILYFCSMPMAWAPQQRLKGACFPRRIISFIGKTAGCLFMPGLSMEQSYSGVQPLMRHFQVRVSCQLHGCQSFCSGTKMILTRPA